MTSQQESPTYREKLLCDLFAEVLDVPEVGVHDRFFDLGGDSISAAELVAAARNAGLAFTRRELFLDPSPARLAGVVREVTPAPAGADGIPAGNPADPRPGRPADPAPAETPLVSLSETDLDEIERRLR
ncbi:phosphopantetheine-binding protein [Streptomyces sp. NPDC058953]|uniref:phosphopantetheine-binding protein n=1 Tax=unclassified Streptomyces TaxID=2593676 RepID=UPI0036C64EDE